MKTTPDRQSNPVDLHRYIYESHSKALTTVLYQVCSDKKACGLRGYIYQSFMLQSTNYVPTILQAHALLGSFAVGEQRQSNHLGWALANAVSSDYAVV